MPKLNEILRINARQSPIDVQCELDSNHPMIKRFAAIEVKRTVIVHVGEIDKPIDVQFTLRACPLCIGTFAYDVALTARDLNGGK